MNIGASRRSGGDLALSAYDLAWRLLLPVIAAAAKFDAAGRGITGRGFLPRNWRVTGRSALPIAGASVPDTVWMHCASLGEAKGLWALALDLASSAKAPSRILVTANTAAGLEFLEHRCSLLRGESSAEVLALVAPFDHPGLMRRFLSGHRIRALCLYEAELWPNYIRVSHDLGIPAMLVSARMSADALATYGRFPEVCARILEKVAWVQAQSGIDLARFRSLMGSSSPSGSRSPAGLGSTEDPIRKIGMGFDFKAAFYFRKPGARIASTPVGRCRLAMLSLHIRELRMILPELPALLRRFDVSVFPRRMRELALFRRLLEPLGFRLHSRDPGARHVLVDAMGLVDGILPSCGIAMVGGSLIPKGCHNLWEPLSAGLKIHFGPWYGNQEGLARPLLERGIAEVVDDVRVMRDWEAPGPRIRAACMVLMEERKDDLEAALADFRMRIFATLQDGPGSAVAATQSRGREP
jgi:3-deoxy-D-manno-octulosonic-acid transferase